jgi:23S rRNA pseudouridine2605 synthase
MEHNYDKKPYGLRNSGYDNNRERRPRTGGGSSRDGQYSSNRGGYNKQNQGGGYRPRFNQDGDGERRSYGQSREGRSYGQSRENQGRGGYQPRNNGGGQGGFRNNKFNRNNGEGDYNPNSKYSQKKQIEYKKQFVDYSQPMRLNKFLANSGICSRREADEYIAAGVVTVNGEVVTELGSKVIPDTDRVMFHDQPVKCEKKVYILLNKPKDVVTTVEDTHARKTVLDLVKNACSERVYPVGRLDHNTTGVLLITNDGDLTTKLTHPKFNKKKIYQVTLDRDLQDEDFAKILSGIVLEDGEIKADELSFVNEGDLRTVGLEIHSGKNRIVRRIFDALGYHVVKLDRVYFAGLTKKNLPRGKWRYLSEMEVTMLKMSASAFKG